MIRGQFYTPFDKKVQHWLKEVSGKDTSISAQAYEQANFWGWKRFLPEFFQSLPKSFLCDFCQQLFSHKGPFFGVTSKKRSSCVFLQTLGAISWSKTTLGAICARIFRVLPIFWVILPGFSRNQNLWRFACTPCTPTSYNTESMPDRWLKESLHRCRQGLREILPGCAKTDTGPPSFYCSRPDLCSLFV